MKQRGGILGILILLMLLVVGAGFVRYLQIAPVSDRDAYQMIRQQLSYDLAKGDLKSLSQSLGAGDLGSAAQSVLSMASKQVVITKLSAAKPLYDFTPYGEMRFAVDYRIEQNNQQGTRYLRYVSSPDQGWRYLGTTNAGGFYSFYLVTELLPDPN